MNYAATNVVFDPQIIRRFDVNGPRYTSYPTADRFVEAFDATAYRLWLRASVTSAASVPTAFIILSHPLLQHDLLLLRLQQDHHQGSRPFSQVPEIPGAKNWRCRGSILDGRRDRAIQQHALGRRYADLPLA
jgi:hypothetical protein